MKRKIVKSGPSTLVVSIPSQYIEKFNLKKGDEIDVQIKDNIILMSYEKIAFERKIKLDFNGIDVGMAWRMLNSAYISGYDNIRIQFEKEDIINQKTKTRLKIRDLLNNMASQTIGMEIIEMGNNYAIFSELAQIKEGEIDSTIKRIFFILKSMVSACLNKEEGFTTYVIESDFLINKFSNYAQRLLSKIGYKNPSMSLAHSRIVDYLEMIGDNIKKIAESKDVNFLKIFKEISIMLDGLYHLYYEYSKTELIKTVLSVREARINLKKYVSGTETVFALFIGELISDVIERIIDINSLPHSN